MFHEKLNVDILTVTIGSEILWSNQQTLAVEHWHWKQRQKEAPSISDWPQMSFALFFFILGKNQRKFEFHKYEIIVSWKFNSKIWLQLRSPSVSLENCEVPYKTCIFLQNWWCGQQPEIFPYCIERNISYELPEIFLSSYLKYFLRATRNISMLHLECCTYSTEKFSWQGLAKSEMDSGKECSVQFWAPNGSNKLLESFLRVSSLRDSFLCSWIDGSFDVTLIMRKISHLRSTINKVLARYICKIFSA